MCTRVNLRARCSAVNSAHDDARIRIPFHELSIQAKLQTTLHVARISQASMGLVASARAARGDVLMRVPKSASITVDYNAGLLLPASAHWPRLRSGVHGSSDPLPWDILQALALIDGLAGDGGDFWQHYCDSLLPPPDQLTLPMCWEHARLAQLQHAEIANAAAAQQTRLACLFPDLAEPLAPDVPSWLQWAFACVRSRAFRAGPDAFAVVPFLDFANHAEAPRDADDRQPQPPTANDAVARPTANADFRVWPPPRTHNSSSSSNAAAATGGDSGVNASGDGGGEFFDLVALREISPGEEVTICYSGTDGYTNQRYMAQYGFVPRGGNPADRIKLDLDDELLSAPLDLARLQDLLGDQLFLGALRGADPYLFAALKSLPLRDGEGGGEGEGSKAGRDPRIGGGLGATRSSAGAGASMRTAAALLRQVEGQLAEGTTPLEDDEEMLAGSAATGGGGCDPWIADPRLAAAVAYRVERKRLLARGAALLRAYVKSGGAR